MKEYSVKEISSTLGTSEETVRRWIRDGKLKANQNSRKEGNVVTVDALREFLKTNPKYAPAAAALAVAGAVLPFSAVTAIPVTAGIIVSSFMGSDFYNKLKAGDSDETVPQEMMEGLKTAAAEIEEKIAQKKELLKQTEEEIKEMEEISVKINELLENGKAETKDVVD